MLTFKLTKFYKLVFILLVLISQFSIKVSHLQASTKPKIEVSPAIIEVETFKDQIIKQTLEIKYKDLKNIKISLTYYSINNYNISDKTQSRLFEDITKTSTEIFVDKININLEIDTKNLEDRTYYFFLGINLNDVKTTENLGMNLATGIPVLITHNTSNESKNPKPVFNIKPNKDLYTTFNDAYIESQVLNSSEKNINFVGEIIVLRGGEIIYSELVSSEDLLKPRQAIRKKLDLKQLSKGSDIKYFGKLNVFIRGTVNNERHIETQKVTIWYIPITLIIAVISTLTIFTLLTVFFIRKRRLKDQNT